MASMTRSGDAFRPTREIRPGVESLEPRALMAGFEIDSGEALFSSLSTSSEHKQVQLVLGPGVDVYSDPARSELKAAACNLGGHLGPKDFHVHMDAMVQAKWTMGVSDSFSAAITRTGNSSTQRIGLKIVAEGEEKPDEMVNISLSYVYVPGMAGIVAGSLTGSVKLNYAVNSVTTELLNRPVAEMGLTPTMTTKIDAKIGDIFYVNAELSPTLFSNGPAIAISRLDLYATITTAPGPIFSTQPPTLPDPFRPAPPLLA
jgi:hypothetical protein